VGFDPQSGVGYGVEGGRGRSSLPGAVRPVTPAQPGSPLGVVPIPSPPRPYAGVKPSPPPPDLSTAARNVANAVKVGALSGITALGPGAPVSPPLSLRTLLAPFTGASPRLNATTTAGESPALPWPRLLVAGALIVGGLSAGGLGRWVALSGALLGGSAIWTFVQSGGSVTAAFAPPQTSAWRISGPSRPVARR
jgi:hypothetical protein